MIFPPNPLRRQLAQENQKEEAPPFETQEELVMPPGPVVEVVALMIFELPLASFFLFLRNSACSP